MPTPPLLQVEDMHQSFGAVRALRGVTLTLRAGSVHAVLGENGAGKSTLMKIIAGVQRPSAGTLRLRGELVQWQNARQAREGGISTIFQEFILLGNLSVAENLCLGREPHRWPGLIDHKAMLQRSREALGKLRLDLNPATLSSQLRVAQQQMVEITRGLMCDADVFVFDEPTAALGEQEALQLFDIIRALRDRGKGVLYISHRLSEIFTLCDEVTVLKDGERTGNFAVADVKPRQLVAAMVGRELEQLYPPRCQVPQSQQETVLCWREVQTQHLPGPVSFRVHRHEIVGLAGLEGQGQLDITRTLFEGRKLERGQIEFLGRCIEHDTPAEAMALGLGLVPEDRKREGLFLGLGVDHNIEAGLLPQAGLWRQAPRAQAEVQAEVQAQVRRLSLRMEHLRQPIATLSGGNQQKALLARWLLRGVKLLICEEPTRGVDIGAKAEIYAILRALADAGVPSLVTSRELPELIGLCDRIIVLRAGRSVGECVAATTSEQAIMHLAVTGSHP